MSPKLLKDNKRVEILEYCEARYGVRSDAFLGWDFVQRKEGIWLHPKGEFKEEFSEVWESSGLRVLSGKSFPFKMTMGFVHLFFKEIKKGIVEVDEKAAVILLKRGSLDVEEYPAFKELTKGYYVFIFEGKPLGIALKTERELVSQVPKSFAAQLKKELKLSN